MNPTTTSGESLFIQRHCMQNLLRAALDAAPKPCAGLLVGGGNMIESSSPVTNFVNNSHVDLPHPDDSDSHPLGIYLSTGSNETADQELLSQLGNSFEKSVGTPPTYCLILDLGHEGRIDASLFEGLQLSKSVTLEMLEESDLYPLSSSR